jgi:hypothetical protein
MNKIKLIAPVRSHYMLEQMIESGADEIYLGLKPKRLKQLSFDGRFQTVADFPAHFEQEEDLLSVIKQAKEHNIRVNFMANASFLPRDLEEEYIQFVKAAEDFGVDTITISSIHTLRLLRKHRVDLPFTAGTAMSPTNIGHIQFLKSIGVSRVTIPHCIKVDEINKWQAEGLEMIITANFGAGDLPGSGKLWESPNNSDMGDGTRSIYRLLNNNGIMEQTNFLDAATDCSLCSITELLEAGISGMKFIGREAPNPMTLSLVVDLFRKWLEMEYNQMTVKQKIEIMEREDLMWTMKWSPRFCEKKRCTYLATDVTSSYV